MRPFTYIMYHDYVEIKKIKNINPKKYHEIEYFIRLYLNQKEDIFWEETNDDDEATDFDRRNLQFLKNQLKFMKNDSRYLYYKKYKYFLKMLDCINN